MSARVNTRAPMAPLYPRALDPSAHGHGGRGHVCGPGGVRHVDDVRFHPLDVGERARAYVNALTSLELRQVAHRPRRLAPPGLLDLGLSDLDPPTWRPLAAGVGVNSAPQSGPSTPPHVSGSFTAIGTERSRDAPDLWRSRGVEDLLFSFTLHGFDELPPYLAAGRDRSGDAFWSQVLGDWLESCAAPSVPGWHPYPLSRRIVAWSAALSAGGWDSGLARALQGSLTHQVRYLRRCVEHEIGGNHVLENAVALTIGGACIGIAGALEQGRRLLRRELAGQVLDDGGHLERSPSYHRQILERLVDAQGVLEAYGEPMEELEAACGSMRRWMFAVAGPDGAVPRLNDGWDGPPVTPSTAPLVELGASGYVTLRSGGDQAVLDVGALCPPHLPPHAHADALSFVLWADGEPMVVDPGSGSYHGEVRAWSRATGTHNTVEIDGESQCVFLGDFRAARLPRVTYERIDRGAERTIVVASHDGYRRLRDPVTHRRTFCWLPGDGLVVVDTVEAARSHRVRSRLHLAPGVTSGRGPLRIRALWGARVEERSGRIAPYLGTFASGVVLEQAASSTERPVMGWSLLRSEAEVRREGGEITVRRPGRPAVRFSLTSG